MLERKDFIQGGNLMIQGSVIFIILIICCFAFAALLFNLHRKSFKKIKNWHYTKTGVITDKIMYSSSKSDAVRPTVRYTVNDKEYVFTSLIGQNPKLRTGKKVGVYYNPENPNEAVIDTFAQRGSIYKLLANVFLVFGLIFVYVAYTFVTSGV